MKADLWDVTLFAHLPGVSLESSQTIPIGLGEIGMLPFDQWQQLDQDFPFNDRQYGESRPVFYKCRASLSCDQDKVFHQVGGWIDLLYRAFLLAPNVPLLPNPRFSAHYIIIESPSDPVAQRETYSVIGAFEKEWIVFGNKIRYSFSNDDLPEIKHIYHLLEATSHERTFDTVGAGLNALELTARPEFWWDEGGRLNRINGFIHCMVALENILLSGNTESTKPGTLTKAFGQHAAILVSPSRNELGIWAERFSGLYKLRSRLIHGQASVENISGTDWENLLLARPLLRSVILSAIACERQGTSNESLAALLSKAHEDVNAYQTLSEQLSEGFQI